MTDTPSTRMRNAVALQYERGDAAPRVVAKGRGSLADRIIEIARDAGVPLYEDTDLVDLLAQVELDAEIPIELYQAVAEVLAFIYQLRAHPETGRAPLCAHVER